MAIPISEEELQLKKRARRRLIGAIALVTVVAVFLPMLLDHEPKPVTQDINIQIPAQNAGTFTSKIVPVIPGAAETKAEPAADTPAVAPPAPPASTPKPVAAPVAEPAKVAVAASKDSEAAPAKAPIVEAKSKPQPVASTDTEAAPPKQTAPEVVPKPKTEAKAKAETKSKSETKAKAAAKAEGGGFVVQVAALNDADKAKQMREQIAAAGVKAYTEVVPTSKGNVTRVRAGPFGSRAAAEKARDKLKDMGLNGNVVPK